MDQEEIKRTHVDAFPTGHGTSIDTSPRRI